MARQLFVRAIGVGLVAGLLMPAVSAATPQAPVRVGGDIKEPRKLTHVDPIYPEIAKQAKVQGAVIMEATIGTDGRVTDVRLLRSNALFDQAAVAAVRQWKYEPTILNGTPVPVLLTLVVNFQLDAGNPSQPSGDPVFVRRLAADYDALVEQARVYRDSGHLREFEQMLQRALDQIRQENAPSTPAAPAGPPPVPDANGVFRVGGLVSEPKRIGGPEPLYPAADKQQGISWMVNL